jgi:hypothetical protein
MRRRPLLVVALCTAAFMGASATAAFAGTGSFLRANLVRRAGRKKETSWTGDIDRTHRGNRVRRSSEHADAFHRHVGRADASSRVTPREVIW